MSELLSSRALVERVGAAALAALIALGSLFLWIGVPGLGMWVAGKLTVDAESFLFAVLGGVPLTMVATGWLLYRLNTFYERLAHVDRGVARRSAWLASHSEERRSLRRARGPRPLVDLCMASSAVLALVVLLVWFLFIAETTLVPLP